MRIVVLGLAIVAAGGCSKSEEVIKGELRTQMMQRCTTDIAPQASAIPGFDAQKFCTCVTDKAIGERSVSALKKMFEDKAGTAEQGRKAGAECLSQQMPGGVPAQAAAAPAGRTAGTEQAAAAPAVEKAETAGEAEEDTNDDAAVEDVQ
jgi:hypothetical protein